MPASWEKALAAAGGALKKAGARAAAVAGGETTNEEAFLLQRLFRERLGSGHLASRPGGELPLDVARALADPALQATIPDLEFAHAVLVVECDPIDEAPVLDLRIRKGVRRHHVTWRWSARGRPRSTRRRGSCSGSRRAAATAAGGARGRPGRRRGQPRRRGDRRRLERAGDARPRGLAARRRRRPGDRLRRARADRGGRAGAAQPRRAARAARTGAGVLEVPSAPNARGLREAASLPATAPASPVEPAATPAASPRPRRRRAVDRLAELRRPGPLLPRPRAVGEGARHRADRDRGREPADRHRARARRRRFPGEAYPEKEGTVTNLDGRVQRLRVAIGRPKGRSGCRARACGRCGR